MSNLTSSLLEGTLVHRRYFPVRHELNYKSVNVFADVDELSRIAPSSWLFGYNSRRLFGINDKNHGRADGTSIAQHARKLFETLGETSEVHRIFMFCSPAVFGKVFNPLTVFFGYSSEEKLVAAICEVSNTFGQRHAYVMAIMDGERAAFGKEFYVSPFNTAQGEYRMTVQHDQNHLRLNIALFEAARLKLCARFEGRTAQISDRNLLRQLPLLLIQPLKILAAIHFEALKLYLKGLRPTPRPSHAKFATTIQDHRR